MFQTIVKIFLIAFLFQSTLQAKTIDINSLIAKAKQSDKHLFVWLHKTGCGYCENMREFTLENEVIAEYVKRHFIFEHINVSENDTVKYQDFIGNSQDFVEEIGYNFYPSSLFFDESGEIIIAEVGFVDTKKNPNEEHMYKILNFVNSKIYKNIDFIDYKYDVQEEF